MGFKDKVAIVTGSSRGIGKAIAIAFAREGADLVLAARTVAEETAPTNRPGTIGSTAEEVRALGRKALAIKTDVSVRSEVEKMVERAVNEFGHVDILVNNAWAVTFRPLPLDDMRPEIADAEIETFRGVVNCCRAVLPHMRSRKYGRIINITSVGGKTKVPTWPVYAGLKAGVAHFSRSIADVVGRDGVTVNCVAPGLIATASTFDIFPKQVLDQMAAGQIVGRMGKEEEVARAVLFLAADESGYINGVHLSVDGGAAPI